MFRFVSHDFSQEMLIDKINQYQALKDRPLISTDGYCHGLAILWLAKMRDKNIDWFYRMNRHIILQQPQLYNEEGVEKFLALIEWGQRPYESGMEIAQRDLRVLLDMKNIEHLTFSGFFRNFKGRIRPKKNPAMYLISNANHSIGVFHDGSCYYVYDSNYMTGEAKTFDAASKATREIMKCLLPRNVRKNNIKFNLEFNFIPLPVAQPLAPALSPSSGCSIL